MTTIIDRVTNTVTLETNVGLPGTAATIAVGTVTTGAPGSSVIITNVGTTAAAELDFTIPRGDPGAGDGDFKADGSVPMTGAFDGGGQNITNVGTVDGRNVATDGTKLDGIATSATANDTDANLKARANHTGTQASTTISDFSTASDARITNAIGTTVQAYDADTLKADTADILTAGFASTPYSAGTKSSGTYTPDEADGNFQYAVNGGAHTLAPPTNNCTICVQYTNNGSAGAVTTSGFTRVTGSFTTTNGDDFFAYITKNNGFSLLQIVALQ